MKLTHLCFDNSGILQYNYARSYKLQYVILGLPACPLQMLKTKKKTIKVLLGLNLRVGHG